MNLFIFVQLIWVFDPFYCLEVFLHSSGWGGYDITRCHTRISLSKLAPFDIAKTAQMGLYKQVLRLDWTGSDTANAAQQGGRTWQSFVRVKNGHENFRQIHIYNFRDKWVVFARNCKFATLTQ